MERFEAIIVGGGHNGLVCAARLAQAGHATLVLERRPLLGGACVTEEIPGAPGFRISTGAAQLSNLPPSLMADLELERFGCTLLLPDPVSVFPFPDERYLAVWQDPARTAGEVARFSAADAAALPGFQRECQTACDILEPLLDADPPCSLDRIEDAFRRAGHPGLFSRFVLGSIRDLIADRFESAQVQAVLAYTATFGTNADTATPGTAYVMLHHMLGGTTGIRGPAAYVQGGMSGLADALAGCAASHGARLMTEAEVARILVRSGRAYGVELTDGRRWEARAVISGADPQTTFLRLVEPEHLAPTFAAAIRRAQSNGVALKVNCAMDALPRFPALPPEMTPARVSLCPSLDYVDAAWADAAAGRPSHEPFMTVHMQSAVDASLAPPDKHSLTCYAQFFPYRLAPALGGWEAQREAAGRIVMDTVAGYAPGVAAGVIARHVMSPLDLERTFAMTGGHQFHLDLMPGQLFEERPAPGCAGARTPLPGLYLCGAGAHPGGCVWGAPGEAAARTVSADLR